MWLILLSSWMALACAQTQDMFNFRSKTLMTFNGARRLLASGDLRKLAGPIEKVIKDSGRMADFKKLGISFDILGPGADMYKMRWSRDLEQIAFEYAKQNDPVKDFQRDGVKLFFNGFKFKEHVGFVWMGDVFQLLDTAIQAIPISQLKKVLNGVKDVLESLIIAIWMGIAMPKTTPIKAGATFGPAEALYASRYEIGCFSKLAYSYCFLNKIEHRPALFKVGVSCSECSTHCEFIRRKDGSAVEGELCVAPKGEAGRKNGSVEKTVTLVVMVAMAVMAMGMAF